MAGCYALDVPSNLSHHMSNDQTTAELLSENASLKARIAELEAAAQVAEKKFPMQGGPAIPWSLGKVIWAGYNAMYPGQSMERIAERHGFGWAEVEVFWNDMRGRSAMLAALSKLNTTST